jgi:hypothetical protein
MPSGRIGGNGDNNEHGRCALVRCKMPYHASVLK